MNRPSLTAVLLALCAAALACSPSGGGFSASDGLVFVRGRGLETDLYRVRLSDGAVRAMWETPDRAELWPYWSDAANQLVFEVNPFEGPGASQGGDEPDHRLMLFDPATRTESPLSTAPALLEHWADWSPDGERILFSFSSHPGVEPNSGLAVTEVARHERRVAVTVPIAARLFRARFAPDGRQFVAQRFSNRARRSRVWLFDLDGAARPLTRGETGIDSKPRFTRDSAQVVFTRRPGVRLDGDIAIVGVDGGKPRILVSLPDADDHAADPSPTRDEIAFASNRTGDYEIWIADLESGALRNLTNTPKFDEGAVHFSPDGERLVMSRTPTGIDPKLPPEKRPAPRLAVLSRDGKKLFETEGFSPDWMPPWK